MLLVAVQSCHSYISSNVPASTGPKIAHVSKKWLSLISSLLEHCWSFWNTAEQTMQTKKAEKESLYRYKTNKHTVEEDEGIEEEVVRRMFPVYDSVFEEGGKDIFEKVMNDEGNGLKNEKEDEGMVCQFTYEEMEEVSGLHLLLFATNTLGGSHKRNSVLSSKYSLAAFLADIVNCIPGIAWRFIFISVIALLTDFTSEFRFDDRLLRVWWPYLHVQLSTYGTDLQVNGGEKVYTKL